MPPSPPRVVIVGAGFAGLAAAQALAARRVPVTVIDRRNHHLFVPLLYQVATAALSPADIAQPIRRILRHARSAEVVLGEVTGIDEPSRRVLMADGTALAFDRLVLATGSRPGYFGHDAWASLAPGLKQVEDALAIRTRLLLAFERAETCDDADERRRLMTIIVVGGGPTGVELAGAVAELARYALSRDFRHIDPKTARILLVEAGPRLLAAFPEPLARFARHTLERLGVSVLLNTPVEDIRPDGATLAGQPVAAGLVIWGAGIAANPAGRWLNAPTDRMGRIAVAPDLSVPGHPGIFALGDIASLAGSDGRPLPALAQVAQQQGRHLGRTLAANLLHGTALPPFRFRNRGNTAVIGRHAAVFDFGRWQLKGWFAWVLWAIVHVYLLVGFEQRVLVTVQWLWRYLTYERGARLITADPAAGAGDQHRTGSGLFPGRASS
jgi:NADH dehydrogenase